MFVYKTLSPHSNQIFIPPSFCDLAYLTSPLSADNIKQKFSCCDHSSESGFLLRDTSTSNLLYMSGNVHYLTAITFVILPVKIYRTCLAFSALAHCSWTKSLWSLTQNLQLRRPVISSWKQTLPSIIYGTFLARFFLFPFIPWHGNSLIWNFVNYYWIGYNHVFIGTLRKKMCYTQWINQSCKSGIREDIKGIFRRNNFQQPPGENINLIFFYVYTLLCLLTRL